ncbi:MAG TPA: zinc ribbon domain-containing protein [Acidimicrobiia bacterium]
MCPTCGAQVRDVAKFCGGCGAQLSSAPAAVRAPAVAQPVAAHTVVAPRRSSRSPLAAGGPFGRSGSSSGWCSSPS